MYLYFKMSSESKVLLQTWIQFSELYEFIIAVKKYICLKKYIYITFQSKSSNFRSTSTHHDPYPLGPSIENSYHPAGLLPPPPHYLMYTSIRPNGSIGILTGWPVRSSSKLIRVGRKPKMKNTTYVSFLKLL